MPQKSTARKETVVKKPASKKPTTQTVTNPSEKLAALLRREGLAAARVNKSQQDLKLIQSEIQKMWDARKAQAAALLCDIKE